MVEVQERRMLRTLLNHSLRCLKHPLDRGKKIRRLGDVMRKCRKVFKGKQQRKSRIGRCIKLTGVLRGAMYNKERGGKTKVYKSEYLYNP